MLIDIEPDADSKSIALSSLGLYPAQEILHFETNSTID